MVDGDGEGISSGSSISESSSGASSVVVLVIVGGDVGSTVGGAAAAGGNVGTGSSEKWTPRGGVLVAVDGGWAVASVARSGETVAWTGVGWGGYWRSRWSCDQDSLDAAQEQPVDVGGRWSSGVQLQVRQCVGRSLVWAAEVAMAAWRRVVARASLWMEISSMASSKRDSASRSSSISPATVAPSSISFASAISGIDRQPCFKNVHRIFETRPRNQILHLSPCWFWRLLWLGVCRDTRQGRGDESGL